MDFGRGPCLAEERQQPLQGQTKSARTGTVWLLLLAGIAAALAVLLGTEHTRRWLGGAIKVATDKLGDIAVLPTWAGNRRQSSSKRQRERRTVSFLSEGDVAMDIYFDDGRLGVRMSELLPRGKAVMLSVHDGDRFFYTVRDQRERMVDLQDNLVESVIQSNVKEVLLSADLRPQGSLCLDRYVLCSKQAAQGRCHAFPGWMIPNCCASCDAPINASGLLDPAVRCHRATLNTTGSRAWLPGDLQQMFADLKDNGRWAKYAPVVLSQPPAGPWVVLLERFLSEDECGAFVAGGDLEGFHHSAVQKEKASAVNSIGELASSLDSSRTSSTAWCSKAVCGAHPLVQQVVSRVEEFTGISKANFEQPQILSYAPGQYCRSHQDSKQWLASTAAGVRILTIFFYLSDVEAGGETVFEGLDLLVTPKKGAALIWPNVHDQDPDVLDDRLFHESLVVKKGLKRAANLWVHMYNVQVAEHWGC